MSAGRPETNAPAPGLRFALSRRSLAQLALGVVVALVVLVFASTVAQDAPGALEVLSDASWPWIGAAVAAQVLCYLFLGVQLAHLFGPERRLQAGLAVRLGLVLYGLGTVTPGAPAPGMVIAARVLARRGIESTRIALAFFLSMWFNVRSFLILAVLTALTATLRHRVPANSRDLVLSAALFVLAALALSGWIIRHPALADRLGWAFERLNWHGTGEAARRTTSRIQEAASGAFRSRRQGFLVAAATLGSRLADVICLRFALIAVGIHMSLGVVLIAYVASTLVAAVPLLPGGLGLVEATVPGVLHYYGASIDAAVAGTVAWRGVSLLLPALAGVAAWASLLLTRTELTAPEPTNSS